MKCVTITAVNFLEELLKGRYIKGKPHIVLWKISKKLERKICHCKVLPINKNSFQRFLKKNGLLLLYINEISHYNLLN